MTSAITPFRIQVPQGAIDDLRDRLRRTRWPGSAAPYPWVDGTDSSFLERLVDHWRDGFDWRGREAALNRFAQYRIEVDGISIHLIHVRGIGPAPRALVLMHGYPSSFCEFEEIVGPLADPARFGGDPADAFDVVVPSLPGYGFSGIPDRPGMTPARIADLWAGMMRVLGYDRYFLHGGDWGAFVSAAVAVAHPSHVAGLHLTSMTLARSIPQDEAVGATDDPAKRKLRKWQQSEMGYVAIQSTKRQSLAYGLTDSPAGLAAWIVENGTAGATATAISKAASDSIAC